MKYQDGQRAHRWDRVEPWAGGRGIVVAVCDDPAEAGDWAYLATGVMVETNQVGLVHVPPDDDELRLVARGSEPDEAEWKRMEADKRAYADAGGGMYQSGDGPSVRVGYVNRNGQRCCGHRRRPGNDHLHFAYRMDCTHCGEVYGANESDVHLRRCPSCQGGAKGVAF